MSDSYNLAADIANSYEHKAVDKEKLKEDIREHLVINTEKPKEIIRENEIDPEIYLKVFRKLVERGKASQKELKSVQYAVKELKSPTSIDETNGDTQ